jgi:cytochrome b involved in lipid metabolism
VALFTFDGLFKLVPIFSLISELYSLYLDSQKKTSTPQPLIKNQKLTWQELKKHDNPSSAYVAINGKVYDVTSFLGNHPGGREFLLLNCGRDATLAF